MPQQDVICKQPGTDFLRILGYRLPTLLVLRAIGLFLISTAALKAYGLAVDPTGTGVFLTNPLLQVGVIEFEFLVGIWLLSGRLLVFSWILAVVIFICFALASLYLAIIGQASCGCFGQIAVSPSSTLIVDSILLVALFAARPSFNDFKSAHPSEMVVSLMPALKILILAVLFSLSLVWLSAYRFGSLDAALAALNGAHVSARPNAIDLGHLKVGDTKEARVELVNWTEYPVTLVGGTSDCSCVVTDDLPLTLGPNETKVISVRIRPGGSSGLFNKKAWIMTTDAYQQYVILRFLARVTDSS